MSNLNSANLLKNTATASYSLGLAVSLLLMLLGDTVGEASLTAKAEQREKRLQVAKTADRYVDEQARAINKIPGMQVKPGDLKEESLEKRSGGHPLGWLFRPIARLQQQSIRLEQQIMKLAGPIASLQPSMLGLKNKMDEVKSSMGHVSADMSDVRTDMSTVRHELGGVSKQMLLMQRDLSVLRQQVSGLKEPIRDLRVPIVRLQKPLSELEQPLLTVGTRMNELHGQLNELKILMSLVLTSIFVAAGVITVGTPIATIMVWRYRQKLLPKPNAVAEKEETLLSRVIRRAEQLDRNT